MSTFDVILWVAMFCTVMLIFCGVCWIMLHKEISKPVVPKPTTFEQIHPNGTHEYRHAYGNWLKCIHCGKMLNRLDLGKKEAQKKEMVHHAIIPFMLVVFLFAGCSSPVLQLRAISQNCSGLNVSRTIDNILHAAQNAAIQGDRYTMARFVISELEARKIARQLLAIDRRFRIEIQPAESFTTIIVRW